MNTRDNDPAKDSYGCLPDNDTITKDEAIMSLYKAIEKIYKGPGSKSEYIHESALYLLKYVSEKHIMPQIRAQSGDDKADIMAKLHKIIDLDEWKHDHPNHKEHGYIDCAVSCKLPVDSSKPAVHKDCG